MKAKIIFSGLVGLALILGSCGSSNSVVSSGLIQKRKYNKGFFLKSNGQFKTAKVNSAEEKNVVAFQEPVQETKAALAHVVPAQESMKVPVSRQALETEVVAINPSKRHISEEKPATQTNKINLAENANSQREVRKSLRSEIKTMRKAESGSSSADMDGFTILLVILAIIIPPLAVILFEGATNRFWIDLILALLGWGLLAWLLPGIFWLGGLAAIIYALLIVLSVI
jgi:uncharacterized membrane protein YqaE (UPF0057 family)